MAWFPASQTKGTSVQARFPVPRGQFVGGLAAALAVSARVVHMAPRVAGFGQGSIRLLWTSCRKVVGSPCKC